MSLEDEHMLEAVNNEMEARGGSTVVFGELNPAEIFETYDYYRTRMEAT